MSEEKIARIEAARKELAAAEADLAPKHEFPKWVIPHPSHIADGVAALFAEQHIDRGGKLSVLVHSADDEARAVAEAKAPEEPTTDGEKPAENPAEKPSEAPAV